MDISLARTFLTIMETGRFVDAAEKLFVTQSTISMRMKELEAQLGQPLFTRNRSGATPTQAGLRFAPHAAALVRVWEQARHETGLGSKFKAVLSVGSQFSLWDSVLVHWIQWLRRTAPQVAIRAEINPPAELMRQITEGQIDIGVMYTPQARPGQEVEHLFDEVISLVATRPNHMGVPEEDFVYVDWGPDFDIYFRESFADTDTPALFMRNGSLGLRYVLEAGGAGYFPVRITQPLIAAGALYPVADAPPFTRHAYAVFRHRNGDDIFDMAIEGLRHAAALENTGVPEAAATTGAAVAV